MFFTAIGISIDCQGKECVFVMKDIHFHIDLFKD